MNEQLKAFSEALSNNTTVTEPVKPFWRLYYDPITGKGLFMSMEDVPGTWIELTQEQYDTLRLDTIAIQDGKIVVFDFTQIKHRLRPGKPAVYTVHKEEHSLAVSPEETVAYTTLKRT